MGSRNRGCKSLAAQAASRLAAGLRRFGLFALFLVRPSVREKDGRAAVGCGCGAAWLRLAGRSRLRLACGFWAACWAWILGLLGRRGRHDAVIMLRMLKIILGHHAVAAGIGVAGQLQILLIDMAGRAADLDLRARGIEGAVGIEAAAAIVAAAAAATAIAACCGLRPPLRERFTE